MVLKKSIQKAQGILIDQLAHFEASISELYGEYGRLFPDRADFWQELAREEKKHEWFLQSMHTLLDKRDVFYNLDAFDVKTVGVRLAEVHAELATAKKGLISPLYSLETAMCIEKSIIDGHFYDVAKSYAPAFAVIADHLSKDTRLHAIRIQDLYIKQQVINRGT
jgi:rubrerythrin